MVVDVTDGVGGVENILFLKGGEPVGAQGPKRQHSAGVY
jgi:hypothetical protein